MSGRIRPPRAPSRPFTNTLSASTPTVTPRRMGTRLLSIPGNEPLPALQEPSLMETPGALGLERGGRHLHSRVSPPHGISNPGEHVAEGIRHRHRVTSSI